MVTFFIILTPQEVDRLLNEVKALQHENGLLKGELRDAKDASEKAPSAVMAALVDKLRMDQVKAQPFQVL